MPTRIAPDFKPSDRVYNLFCKRFGLTFERSKEFIGHELDEFMLYWEGRQGAGAAKENWDSTCLNWMKRCYEDKKEAMARNRSFGGQQENIFQQTVGNMIASDMPKPQKRRPLRIVNTPIPGEGETMSTEDALEQLKQISRG